VKEPVTEGSLIAVRASANVQIEDNFVRSVPVLDPLD
jgi:hypothetical protein